MGWSKLNTDASVSSNPHFAGGGGLLCNSNGDWIRGVSHSIGSTSILLAELWALRDGLIMARSLGIQKIIVNVDASDINSLVFSSNSINRLTQPPVADCRAILQVFQHVKLEHCYREAKREQLTLAKISCRQPEPFIYYIQPPPVVLEALSSDCISVPIPRPVWAIF